MPRVLVIDDEPDLRELIRELLDDAGYEVVEAANGREGVARFAEAPTDLVITDIMMPEQDGIQTVIELRRTRPSTKIIAISGGGPARNLDFLQFAKRVGAVEVLVKPFTNDQLVGAVKKALETSGQA